MELATPFNLHLKSVSRSLKYFVLLFKVFVPLTHNGEKSWRFKLVCPGNAKSVSHEKLLLQKIGTVNMNLGFDEVCKEKIVYAAYNNDPPVFAISNITGEMVRYPLKPYVAEMNVAQEWEIQAAFLEYNNITNHWINANFTWGWLDNVTNQWTGAVGLIERDEADYAICCFGGSHGRSMVAAFSPGIQYLPYYWLTRYPLELPPTWNLLGLFTKGLKLSSLSSKSQIPKSKDLGYSFLRNFFFSELFLFC